MKNNRNLTCKGQIVFEYLLLSLILSTILFGIILKTNAVLNILISIDKRDVDIQRELESPLP
ncbi:MAG: hypothetical protein KDD52_04580 [Bdellovibrionales bacterium]|nr:hypothetical protein [Bdellovibrionales bacterium]